jgi:hypothetical protein
MLPGNRHTLVEGIEENIENLVIPHSHNDPGMSRIILIADIVIKIFCPTCSKLFTV